jgi:NADH-quinone oxidoreductase subunit M
MLGFWLVAVPWAGLLLFLWPRRWAKGWALVLALAEVALFGAAWAGVPTAVDWNWIPDLGVHFHLAADGLGLFLVGLAAVVSAAVVLASPRDEAPAYYFWILLAESATMGVFLAQDLVTFYVFWEVVLIPIFFLLSGWAKPNGRATALRWLVMNLFGSFFMLVGLVAVGLIHQSQTGVLTFQLAALAHTRFTGAAAFWLFLAFLVAFMIKAPLWPLHGWMPSAYGEAPAPVTALLSGVLSKLGVFAMLRVLVPLFFPQMRAWEPWLIALAVVGLVYGAVIALRTRDVKMVVAYASLSHLAMMSLGIFTLTTAGAVGATFYMVAHGLMAAGLFLIVGWLERVTGTRELTGLSGLNRRLPRLAAWFQLFALATLGLPGLAGFAGEYMIFQGLVHANVTAAAVAGVVLVLASWYMIRVFQGAMQSTPRNIGPLSDLSWGQVALIGALGVMVVVLGVWPASITAHFGLHTPTAYHVLAWARRGGEAA